MKQLVKMVKWLIAGLLVVFLIYWCMWVIGQRKRIVSDSVNRDIYSHIIRVGMTKEQVEAAWNCSLSLCYVGSDSSDDCSVYEGWTHYPCDGTYRIVFYNGKLKEWYVTPNKK